MVKVQFQTLAACQTVQTQIRLPLKKQSDQDLPCLLFLFETRKEVFEILENLQYYCMFFCKNNTGVIWLIKFLSRCISLLKWYLPSQFHNCIPYTDNKISQSTLRKCYFHPQIFQPHPREILPKALVLQDECFGKNLSSFLDFTTNYKRTSGIFVPWAGAYYLWP